MKRLFLCTLLLVLCSTPAFAVLGGYNNPILDTNNNGLSDVWERIYNNGELFPSMSPLNDDDSDGWTNAEEAIAGTDPESSLSPDGMMCPMVAILHDVSLDLDNNGTEFYAEVATITWPVIAGKFYTLLYSPDMTGDSWLPLQQAAATSDGTRTAYFPVSSPDDKMFWRVSIEDIDSDGDGLTDAEEYKLGIDPHNAQTIDGIPDYWLAAHFTNILLNGGLSTIDPDADPDGDGYTNLQEAFLNTNPNVSNTPITGPIGQETIVNGDFSEPAIGSGNRSGIPDPTWDYWGQGGVPGWSAVVGTHIEFQNITPEENGNQCVELKAYPAGHYGITQDVGTRKGATYVLTLDCRDRADVAPVCSNFNLLIDGQIFRQINFSDSSATTLPSVYVSPGAWATVEVPFTATKSVTRISLVPVNRLNETTGCLLVNLSLARVNIVPDDNMAGVVGDTIRSAKMGSLIGHFVTPKAPTASPQDYVVLKATGITPDQITQGNAHQIFAWDDSVGESVPGEPMKWRVKRDVAGNYGVMIRNTQDNSIATQMRVWVVWANITPTKGTPIFKERHTAPGAAKYEIKLTPTTVWRFKFSIVPPEICSPVVLERPDLAGPNQKIVPGNGKPYADKPTIDADSASSKWDVSRQVKGVIYNPDSIPAIYLQELYSSIWTANQPTGYNCPVPYPDSNVEGNDDAPGADEDDDPYHERKDDDIWGLRGSLDHAIGEITSVDGPRHGVYNSWGLAGQTFAIEQNFREFARLELWDGTRPNGTFWFRISDDCQWHFYLETFFDTATNQWKDGGSSSDLGHPNP